MLGRRWLGMTEEIDPADEDAVFAEATRLEMLSMLSEATLLLERLLSSPTPSRASRYHAELWIATHGAPPEKAYLYGEILVRAQPDDLFAWYALSFAADRCGRTQEAVAARARAAEIEKNAR